MKPTFRDILGSDIRSLALFRIALALLILFDLGVRSLALVAHYTDAGVLPRFIYSQFYQNSYWFSFHLMSGHVAFQAMLFIIAAAFAIMLLAGWQTRLATIISWLLLISLHNRNPLVLQGGDILFRLLLFWAMFLPLGAAWSLDARAKKKKENTSIANPFFSVATIALYVQFASVYIFSALLKTGREWFPDGTAIYYALSLDQFATTLGKYLLNFPELMIYLTFFVLFLELLGPLLLFVPYRFNATRMAVITLFLLLPLGMGLGLRLGPFPWICAAAVLPFLPKKFWETIFSKVIKMKKRDNALTTGLRAWLVHPFNKNKPNISINPRKADTSKKALIANIIAAFFLILVVLWNIQTLGHNALPNELEPFVHITRTDQYWNMFSPFPLKEDGWYVMTGTLRNGEQVNILRPDELLTYDKPASVADTYPMERWRKYLMNLWSRDNARHRQYYLTWFCHDWNSQHKGPELLQQIDMVFILEVTLPHGEAPPEKIVLETKQCW